MAEVTAGGSARGGGAGAIRVEPGAATRLPGDEAVEIRPGEAGELRIAASGGRATLVRAGRSPVAVVLGVDRPATSGTSRSIELVVRGWHFELEVEDAARAELRDRATRGAAAAHAGGPLEVRAMIPGRVASVAVNAGDAVEAGEPLLVVEAMKMQNEIRAPKAGVVERVAVRPGETIELGDLLVVLDRPPAGE